VPADEFYTPQTSYLGCKVRSGVFEKIQVIRQWDAPYAPLLFEGERHSTEYGSEGVTARRFIQLAGYNADWK